MRFRVQVKSLLHSCHDDSICEDVSRSKRARMKASRLSRNCINGSKQKFSFGPSDCESSLTASNASGSKNENEQMKVKLEAQQSGVNELLVCEESISGCLWLLGDVAWARVGGHPFWPCIISYDPDQKAFTKTSLRGTTVMRSLHVQFFADNGRRSWLPATYVIPFEGVEALNKLQQKLKKEVRKRDKKLLSAFSVRSSAKASWNEAVREAVLALKKTRPERLQDFTKRFPIIISDDKTAKKKLDDSQEIERPRKKRKYSHYKTTSVQIKQEADANPPVSLNKSTKSNSASPRTKSATSTPVVKKKYHKKNFMSSDDMSKRNDKRGAKVFVNKFRDRVASDYPHLDKKGIKKYLLSDWNRMDKDQKAKFCALHFPDNVTEDSETSPSEEENDAESSNKERTETRKSSLAPLRSPNFILRKDGGLFCGTRQEKVCQICEKPGDTVKYKGPCSGSYHVECLAENRENKKEIPIVEKNKRGRRRSSKIHVIQDQESHSETNADLTPGADRIISKTLSKEKGKDDKYSTQSIEVETKKEEKDETNAEEFRCKHCQAGKLPACFACGKDKEEKTSVEKRCCCTIGISASGPIGY